MDDDDLRTLDMQMQRPGPMGVKNVMVAHTPGEKVADDDLLLVANDSGYFVDPENADDAVQSIKPQTTVKYMPPYQCTLFGIVYAAQQQQFSLEENDKTAVNTPACTVTGTNAVINLSGDVISAFEKLTFGPVKDVPPNWRQPSSATVTLRRVSPVVWRTHVLHLTLYAHVPGLDALFQREYRETCPYTIVPALMMELVRFGENGTAWTLVNLNTAMAPYLIPVNTPDGEAQDEEYKTLFREFNNTWATNTPDNARNRISMRVMDMYYDCLRNQEMMSLGRCPVYHRCETLIRF